MFFTFFISGVLWMMFNKVVFDGQLLAIEDICLIARQQAHVDLSQQAEFVTRIDKGALFIDSLLREEGFCLWCYHGVW
jgi:histidine ammonia-lyase